MRGPRFPLILLAVGAVLLAISAINHYDMGSPANLPSPRWLPPDV